MYYFGCGNGAGHYLWNPNWSSADRRLPDDFPLARYETLDGGLLPLGEQHVYEKQVEGRLRVWRTDGWAILTWWDRSVDTRPACNSAFVMRLEPKPESVEDLLRRGIAAFPKVAQRIKYQFTYGDEVFSH